MKFKIGDIIEYYRFNNGYYLEQHIVLSESYADNRINTFNITRDKHWYGEKEINFRLVYSPSEEEKS